MKVAYVCADLGIPVFGKKGASIHVQEIIRALLKRGDEVCLFAAKLGGSIPEDLQAIKVFSVDAAMMSASGQGDCAEQREANAEQVAELLYQQMLCCDEFDLIYERYSLWSSVGCRYAQEHKIPCIAEVNAPLIEEQSSHRHLVNVARARMIEHQVFSCSTSIIAVSQGVADYIHSVNGNTTPVTVIANGVNLERFISVPRKMASIGETVVSIGFIGTLKPWHGVDSLLQAFAGLHQLRPQTRLIVVGDGPMRTSLVAIANELRIEKAIDWIGSVDAESVPQWLAPFDIAVAPYPQLEGFYFSPLKLFEYMASGIAVVASRIGQICEIVDDGLDGLLVEPGDSEHLQQALLALVDNPRQRKLLGQRGRDKAMQHFDWSNVLQQILATVALPGPANEAEKRIDYAPSS